MTTKVGRGEPAAESDTQPAPSAGDVISDRFTTDEVFGRIVATAEDELKRGQRQLAFSGLAAGLTVGASILARISITARLGATPEAYLLGNALYGLGFVFIVLGRYQLFTENTLTPVTLVLDRRASVPTVLRLWIWVLTANLVGAAAVAAVLSQTGVLSPEMHAVALDIGKHSLAESFGTLIWKSVFAGGLIATMVWLAMAVRDSTARIVVVFLVVYVIPTADLHHCVFGSEETLYVVMQGEASFLSYLRFLGGTVLGNTIGGIGLVTLLNYAQTERSLKQEPSGGRLSLKESVLGRA